jgi:Ca2+-binding RTX toxin-like protein
MTLVTALVLLSGVALAVTRQCKTGIECYGTRESDTLKGTDGIDYMYGKGAGDTLKGFGGDDYLTGQGGSDKLFGASGLDRLYPGPGNDVLDAGDGNDSYYFEANKWGKDRITDTDVSDNLTSTGNWVSFDDGLTANLTITLNSDSGSLPEVRDASGTSTVNWGGNVIMNAEAYGSGDDTIYGNGAANHLTGAGGTDTINAAEGDDFIEVNDGAGGDTVDCGENAGDNDTVKYDGPTMFALGDFVTNCEVLDPR